MMYKENIVSEKGEHNMATYCPFADATEKQKLAFSSACRAILMGRGNDDGIGTLGEKTLHATIKQYLSPNPLTHEIKIDRYVADIKEGDHIFEIQTGSFERLKGKLACYLQSHDVTVVYPILTKKWVVYIDKQTGKLSEKTKSHRPGNVYQIFDELYHILPFLSHPRFSLRLLLLEGTDYRIKESGRRGRVRTHGFEHMPSALLSDTTLSSLSDYLAFLPPPLPSPFLSSDLKTHANIPLSTAQSLLWQLHKLGIVLRVGKAGNAYQYQLYEPNI